jgi:hypothetical protein
MMIQRGDIKSAIVLTVYCIVSAIAWGAILYFALSDPK